mgnify:CR=1 FL=1
MCGFPKFSYPNPDPDDPLDRHLNPDPIMDSYQDPDLYMDPQPWCIMVGFLNGSYMSFTLSDMSAISR